MQVSPAGGRTSTDDVKTLYSLWRQSSQISEALNLKRSKHVRPATMQVATSRVASQITAGSSNSPIMLLSTSKRRNAHSDWAPVFE